MTPPHDSDFHSLEQSALLRMVTSRVFHPNLLVAGADVVADAVVRQLTRLCSSPFYDCTLPGLLQLPDGLAGTLFLRHVDAMTLRQQIALHDWMTAHCGQIQVVSVTTVRLEELVHSGRFLEGLFYRLNVVRLDWSDIYG